MVMMFDEATPRSRVAVLLKEFSQIDDDREPWRVAFPLAEVLLLLTCATIADCDDSVVGFGGRAGDLASVVTRSENRREQSFYKHCATPSVPARHELPSQSTSAMRHRAGRLSIARLAERLSRAVETARRQRPSSSGQAGTA